MIRYSRGLLLLTLGAILLAPVPAAAQRDPERLWIDRRTRSDIRERIERQLGYAPPFFTPELQWFDGEDSTWDALRGKVVIVQTWTRKNASAMRWPDRLAKSFPEPIDDDLVLLALHTPEGAADAQLFLDRRPPPEQVRIVLDHTGRFCDQLGEKEKPVNFVIDRAGAVRYAGLNLQGLKGAANSLLAESFDPESDPPDRAPEPEVAEPEVIEFPASQPSRYMADFVGESPPPLDSLQWFESTPELHGVPLMIEFYATWCPHCQNIEPYINRIARDFADEMTFVTVSTEDERTARNLHKSNRFARHIAHDTDRALVRNLKVRGFPSAILVSSDGVVRWQGSPFAITPNMLKQFLRADRANAIAAD